MQSLGALASLMALPAVLGLGLVACGAPVEEDADSSLDAIRADAQSGLATALPEAVQILMQNGRDYCTGVLVAPNRVVTAAHCILHDPSWTQWTVRASNAPGAPSVQARFHGVVSRSYESAENGDVGVLALDAPIRLATYATLTDVGARADGGETFRAVVVGRARQARDAAIVKSKPLTVSSARSDGYRTGLKTEYYSEGGDSGGGLFLLEDGQITHKVIGFERQPYPASNVDFFTRVDAALINVVARGSAVPARGGSAPAPAPSSTSR
jgi:hypothetical protein